MATELDRLVFKIVGDATQYLNELKRVSDETSRAADRIARQSSVVDRFFSSITNQAQAAASALSALGSGNWLRENLNFFGQMESAMMRLTAAIEANGQSATLVMQDYNAFTETLVKQTTVTRIAAAQMFQYAEGMGVTGDAAMRAVKNTTALMALRPELSMMRALRMTTALEHGRTGPIERAFPMLGSIKDSGQRVTAAQEQLTKAWSAAEAQAGSFSGQMTKLGNDLWWLANRYGDVIAEGAKPFVEWLRETLQWITKASEPTKRFAATLGVVTTAIAGLVASLRIAVPLSAMLMSPWGLIAGGIVAGVTLWVHSMGGLDKAFQSILKSGKEFWDWFGPIKMAFMDVASRVGPMLMNVLKNLGGLFQGAFGGVDWNQIRDNVVKTIYFIEYVLLNFGKTTENVWGLVKDWAELAWSWVKLQAAKGFDYLVYVFRQGIPALLTWLGDNWESVWKLMADFTVNVLGALVNAAQGLITGADWEKAWGHVLLGFLGVAAKIGVYLDQLSIDVAAAIQSPQARQRLIDKWNDLWKAVGEEKTPQDAMEKAIKGAENIIAKVRRNEYGFGELSIPKYVPSQLLKKIQEEFDQIKGTTLETWPEFFKRRLMEMKNSKEILNEAEQLGINTGSVMTKGLEKETKKFDNVLHGSAEDLRRIAEYTSKLFSSAPREGVVGKNPKYNKRYSSLEDAFGFGKLSNLEDAFGFGRSKALSNLADAFGFFPNNAAPDDQEFIPEVPPENPNNWKVIPPPPAPNWKVIPPPPPLNPNNWKVNPPPSEKRKIVVAGDYMEQPDLPLPGFGLGQDTMTGRMKPPSFGNSFMANSFFSLIPYANLADRYMSGMDTAFGMHAAGTSSVSMGDVQNLAPGMGQLFAPGESSSVQGKNTSVALSETERLYNQNKDREAVQALLEATRLLIDLLRPKTGSKVTTLELED